MTAALDANAGEPGTRGALLVVEGLDRSGKTTQCSRLVDALRSSGISVIPFKFPDRTTETGVLLDQFLRGNKDIDDHAVHLLFSANRWESMANIKNLLLQGHTLVVDRYAFSGVAYSAAKGLDLNWCKCPDQGLLRPDGVFFLDLDPQIAAQRADYGAERYERIDFQSRVRLCFHELKDELWQIMDASQDLDTISAKIVSAAKDIISMSARRPLKHNLWM